MHEPQETTQRYLDLVTRFPAYVKHYGVVPKDNEYLAFLKILNDRKPGLTVADVWAFERKKKFYNPETMEDRYRKEIYAKMLSSSIFRKAVNHERVMNIPLGKFNYKEIKNWLDIRLDVK